MPRDLEKIEMLKKEMRELEKEVAYGHGRADALAEVVITQREFISDQQMIMIMAFAEQIKRGNAKKE